METSTDAGFNRELFSNAALLVIDIQRGLFDRPIPIYRSDELLQNICSLMDRARQARAPVVIIQHSNDGMLKEGSESWLLHPGISMQDGDIFIPKKHGSAFEQTPLKTELNRFNIKTVIISGLVTHGCVKAACLDAQKIGYRTILVQDAHSNYHRQAAQVIQEWNEKLSKTGIELRTAEQIEFAESSN